MENNKEFLEFISSFGSILSGLATIAACIIATKGLEQWRSQLKTEKKYHAAVNLIKSVKGFGAAMDDIRQPYMAPSEIYSKDGVSHSEGTKIAYDKRWEPHSESPDKKRRKILLSLKFLLPRTFVHLLMSSIN